MGAVVLSSARRTHANSAPLYLGRARTSGGGGAGGGGGGGGGAGGGYIPTGAYCVFGGGARGHEDTSILGYVAALRSFLGWSLEVSKNHLPVYHSIQT